MTITRITLSRTTFSKMTVSTITPGKMTLMRMTFNRRMIIIGKTLKQNDILEECLQKKD